MHIAFSNLTATLAVSGFPIVSGVHGSLVPGRLTALMGSSGCGKTTLLSALMGIPNEGVTVSGAPTLPAGLVGNVPQKDQFHGSLSVYHALWSSAVSRLPSGHSAACSAAASASLLGLLPHSAKATPCQWWPSSTSPLQPC